MPPENGKKTRTNGKSPARKRNPSPDPQPSLLDALETVEPGGPPEARGLHETYEPHEPHEPAEPPEAPEMESPATPVTDTGQETESGIPGGNPGVSTGGETADLHHSPPSGAADDEPPTEPTGGHRAAGNPSLRPLREAYDRYCQIINDTYDAKFSDAKRDAAFKEAAKAHGVRIADLRRYSTAAALGIPYHGGAKEGSAESVQSRGSAESQEPGETLHPPDTG